MVKGTRRLLVRLISTVLMLFLAAGCMYGNEIKQQGAPASSEYIALVQSAMEQYQKKTGLLPIRNKDEKTPVYERYHVDFDKLKNARLLTSVPVNAFENGGTAIYVIVNTETKPQIKLLDLVSYQQLTDLQADVDRYMTANKGSLPKADEVAPGVWSLDFAKLKRKPEQIRSPYSRQFLGVIMNEAGTLYADYGPDIQRVLKKNAVSSDASTDLRELLVNESYFVPARSTSYFMKAGVPFPRAEQNPS